MSPDNSSTVTFQGEYSVDKGLEIGLGDFTVLFKGQKIFLQNTDDCFAFIVGCVEMSIGIHKSPKHRQKP
jgi:hypothetical protein